MHTSAQEPVELQRNGLLFTYDPKRVEETIQGRRSSARTTRTTKERLETPTRLLVASAVACYALELTQVTKD
jgi:hypothetical protein